MSLAFYLQPYIHISWLYTTAVIDVLKTYFPWSLCFLSVCVLYFAATTSLTWVVFLGSYKAWVRKVIRCRTQTWVGIPLCYANVMSDAVGFACIALSCVFWGSNFVPVKEFPTGNGLYYQWIMAMGIWLTGLVAYLLQGCPPFVPILLIGGLCWATGL